LSVKSYVRLISNIGKVLAMRDEDYKKEKVKAMRMDESSLAEALISAFGDGK